MQQNGTLFIAALMLALPWPAAETALSAERSDYPPSARKWYEGGQEFEKRGQYREAIEAYDEAIRLGMTDFPRVHLHRAKSQLALKAYDSAIAQYTKFIEEFSIEESCRH